MSMTGTVLALLATGAAKVRIPVADPRRRRIAELEASLARLTEERDALQEGANAFAKQHAQEKARADSLTNQLVEARAQASRMTDGYRSMAEMYRREHARNVALEDRLTMYEGRPSREAREHLCCIPARHDFFYRTIESFLPRGLAPRTAPHEDLDTHTRGGGGGGGGVVFYSQFEGAGGGGGEWHGGGGVIRDGRGNGV